MDQENIGCMIPEKVVSTASNSCSLGSNNRVNYDKTKPTTTSKRPLNDMVKDHNPKRMKMDSSSGSQLNKKTKTIRKKLIPLGKGQKTLNSFFRI